MKSHATTEGGEHDQGQRQPAQGAPHRQEPPGRPDHDDKAERGHHEQADPAVEAEGHQHDRGGEGGGKAPRASQRAAGGAMAWGDVVEAGDAETSCGPATELVGGSSMPGCGPRVAGSSAPALIGGSFGRPPLLVPSVRYQCLTLAAGAPPARHPRGVKRVAVARGGRTRGGRGAEQ